MHKQLPLFTEEELPAKKPKPKKKEKPPALLDGKVYHEFPRPPNYQDVPSVDWTAAHWTAKDWDLHMNKKHPHINYEND